MGGLKNENVRTWVDLSRKCVVWVGGSTNHLDHHVYPPKYEVPPPGNNPRMIRSLKTKKYLIQNIKIVHTYTLIYSMFVHIPYFSTISNIH